MSWKSSVSALIMSKLGSFLCHRLLCCFSRAFHSLYGQLSRPVAVLSFVCCNALLTRSSVIFQFIVVLSGSSRCWFVGILFRMSLIIVLYSSMFAFGSMSSFWRASWWLQASSAILLELRSYCGGLVLGIFSLCIRLLGLFSLPSADHIPPSHSLWFASFAFIRSFLFFMSFFLRCLSWLERMALHACVSLFVLMSGLLFVSLRSFSSAVMQDVILW